jgi:hypothetical protein
VAAGDELGGDLGGADAGDASWAVTSARIVVGRNG